MEENSNGNSVNQTLSIPGSKHNASTGDISWRKCIICQVEKLSKKRFPLSKATAVDGIQRMVQCANLRLRK